MTDLLGQFETAVSGELKAVTDAASSLLSTDERAAAQVGRGDFSGALGSLAGGHSEAAREIANAFAGPLVGSSIAADGTIRGPLAKVFGSNPISFAINGVKNQHSRSVDLVTRLSQHRVGKKSLKVKDERGKTHDVSLQVTNKSSPQTVALALVAAAAAHPAQTADEAQRIMLGTGPGRGLDGFVGVRHLFGIDDAVIFGAIVSILVAIAPVIIGTLVSVAGPAIDAVTGKTAKDEAAKKQASDQQNLLIGGGVVAVALVIGLALFLHHKKGAAPAAHA